jgi:hypothetical protein
MAEIVIRPALQEDFEISTRLLHAMLVQLGLSRNDLDE